LPLLQHLTISWSKECCRLFEFDLLRSVNLRLSGLRLARRCLNCRGLRPGHQWACECEHDRGDKRLHGSWPKSR
ncbi:MAG: hypothetical protein ACKOFW_24005, partial [Planctomycetaceae bacterium]